MLSANNQEAVEKTDRLRRVEESLAALTAIRGLLEQRLGALEKEVGSLRDRRNELSAEVRLVADRLEGLRRERSSLEKRLTEMQEIAASNEIAETERRFKADNLREMLRNDLNADSDEALAAAEPTLGESVTPVSYTHLTLPTIYSV